MLLCDIIVHSCITCTSQKITYGKHNIHASFASSTSAILHGFLFCALLFIIEFHAAKINPHADIGIDFDSINRKEKRKEEKKVSATPISTTTMGKAMGSGSGIGRAGANTLIRPPNPTMGMGMMGGVGMGMGMMGGGGMGMGMVGNGGMGMGGYGGSINQPMGMGMPPRPPMGTPMGGTGMPGVGYNPMMGMGNYGSQQPYGGGYR